MAEAKKSTAAKVASPKATVKPPAGEPQTEPVLEPTPAPVSDVDVTSAESQEPAQEPIPDEKLPAETDEDQSDDLVLTEDDEPNIEAEAPEELVNVVEPCPKCYPGGWFEHEEGVTAACAHLRVVYGTPVVITAKLAKELGFKPMGKGEGE